MSESERERGKEILKVINQTRDLVIFGTNKQKKRLQKNKNKKIIGFR